MQQWAAGRCTAWHRQRSNTALTSIPPVPGLCMQAHARVQLARAMWQGRGREGRSRRDGSCDAPLGRGPGGSRSSAAPLPSAPPPLDGGCRRRGGCGHQWSPGRQSRRARGRAGPRGGAGPRCVRCGGAGRREARHACEGSGNAAGTGCSPALQPSAVPPLLKASKLLSAKSSSRRRARGREAEAGGAAALPTQAPV